MQAKFVIVCSLVSISLPDNLILTRSLFVHIYFACSNKINQNESQWRCSFGYLATRNCLALDEPFSTQSSQDELITFVSQKPKFREKTNFNLDHKKGGESCLSRRYSTHFIKMVHGTFMCCLQIIAYYTWNVCTSY